MNLFKRLISVTVICTVILLSSANTVFAEDPVLNGRDDYIWGVTMHSQEQSPVYSNYYTEDQIHLAAEMGINLVRIGISTLTQTDKCVQLANAYGMKVMMGMAIPGLTFDDNYDVATIKQTFKSYAQRYNGKNGHGKIDFFQIDNELDLQMMYASTIPGDTGTSTSNYDPVFLKNLTPQVAAAADGIREAGGGIRSVINFSWTHYGFLKYFRDHGVSWDVIGHDWYSDGFVDNRYPGDYYWVGDILYKEFGKEIILCETNLFGKTADFDENDVSNWDPLIQCMQDCYRRDFVIGTCFYELMDEPQFENDGGYNIESHFGLFFNKPNGEIISPKPIYYRLQKIIGGGKVEKLDWDKVSAMYKDDAGAASSESQTNSQTAPSSKPDSEKEDNTSVVKVTNVTEEQLDPIVKESTVVDTVVKKIPVPTGKFFTLQTILAIVFGALAVGYTAFTAVYLIKKNKSKTKRSVHSEKNS